MNPKDSDLGNVRDYYSQFDEEDLLRILRLTEDEPSVLGASPHLLCVARKG